MPHNSSVQYSLAQCIFPLLHFFSLFLRNFTQCTDIHTHWSFKTVKMNFYYLIFLLYALILWWFKGDIRTMGIFLYDILLFFFQFASKTDTARVHDLEFSSRTPEIPGTHANVFYPFLFYFFRLYLASRREHQCLAENCENLHIPIVSMTVFLS